MKKDILLKMFSKYPSIITSCGSIVFLKVEGYDIEKDILKTEQLQNKIYKRLRGLSKTLSTSAFYKKASEDTIIKLCKDLLRLEYEEDTLNIKLNYLYLAKEH